jgi:acyl-CoA thioester hydrolase
MARIKLEIPEKVIGTFLIPVRISDINYGNHVGNDAFVSLVHEARVQWLQQYGYTELSVEGIGLIMSDLALEFKSESFYGDVVELLLGVSDISRVGFDLYYQLFAKRDTGNILLANAKTGMVCYDYEAKKVAPVPEKLKAILEG